MIAYFLLEDDAKTHAEAHRLPYVIRLEHITHNSGQKRKITLLVCIFKVILVMACYFEYLLLVSSLFININNSLYRVVTTKSKKMC